MSVVPIRRSADESLLTKKALAATLGRSEPPFVTVGPTDVAAIMNSDTKRSRTACDGREHGTRGLVSHAPRKHILPSFRWWPMGQLIDIRWQRQRAAREAARQRYFEMMWDEARAQPTQRSWIPLRLLCEPSGLTLRELRFLCDNGLPHWEWSPRRWAIQPEAAVQWLAEFLPDPSMLPIPKRRPAIPNELRERVLCRDGHRCVECGSTNDLTMDHVKPYSRGGRDTFTNLRALCRSCNSRKCDRWVEETL